MPSAAPSIAVAQLLERYRVFLVDAYGVLVTSSGALPGAAELIAKLNREGRPYYVLTNDASRLPETAAAYYRRCGLEIPDERVLTAGTALETELGKAVALAGQPLDCFVFGTPESIAYVDRAGARAVPIAMESDCDAVVIADDSGFEFLPTMNAALSSLHRQARLGRKPRLWLANSDFLYPRGGGAYGYTSGAIARLLQQGLSELLPGETALRAWVPEILGKPAAPLFRLALERAARERPELAGVSLAGHAVMIGDQLPTDVRGANALGIASALVGTGLTRLPLPANLASDLRPTHLLTSLAD